MHAQKEEGIPSTARGGDGVSRTAAQAAVKQRALRRAVPGVSDVVINGRCGEAEREIRHTRTTRSEGRGGMRKGGREKAGAGEIEVGGR